ncbi:MAG: metallophosphoesterase [Victivallales bacterium]|nr:metallophosphoesterase [Victivallales bacterium]
MAKKLMVFTDCHIPVMNPVAIEIFKKTVSHIKPDISVSLGDLLDCGQFSQHPPTFGVPETDYEGDLRLANELIDYVQANTSERTILIEGNHEYRLDRWAAQHTEGRGAYNMLAPRIQLMKNRKRCTYIPYGSTDGRYPHYKINSRIIAVHGWSYAVNADRRHLQMSQGRSVLFGHTHRLSLVCHQSIYGGDTIRAVNCGCLCNPVPLYGTGRPVEWTNGFLIGYLGRHSDTLFPVDIKGNFAILPDGFGIVA